MTEKNIHIGQVQVQAEQYYRQGDFYCSEAVLKALKDAFHAPYDDSIIRLASGFPVGMGAGCTCGAVNGAVMAIGMFFGRSSAKGEEVKKAMQLTKELQEIFAAKRRVCCCKILTKGMELGSNTHMEHCIAITGEVTAMAATILARELGYIEKKVEQ